MKRTRALSALVGLAAASALLLTGCGGKTPDPDRSSPSSSSPPPPSLISFSASPSAAFFGDEHLAYDYVNNGEVYYSGSNIASYMAAYISRLYPDATPTFSFNATQGATLSTILSAVKKAVAGETDLVVLQLGDNDAARYHTGQEQYSPEKYKAALNDILTTLEGKQTKKILVVGPFSDEDPDTELRQNVFPAYQQAVEELCKGRASVLQYSCQDWLDAWSKEGEIRQVAGGLKVLNPEAQMRLSAELIQQTHMTSLNQRTTAPETASFSKDFTLVFAGDSITDAGRGQTIEPGMNLGLGYVSFAQAYLKAQYGDSAPTVLNAGVSGNTVAQLFSRFKTDVDAFSPDCLVVLIGINDAYTQWTNSSTDCTPEKYATRLTRIMHDYADEYKRVVFVTPFYLEDHDQSVNRKQYLDSYVAELKTVVDKYDNASLVDAQAVFDEALARVGEAHLLELSPDRVHLTSEGHRLLMTAILAELQY